ncbi:MAG TPA: hypothetical protein VFU21_07990 [Kofleriaceae bacterium]|nr:hypothetical protein [Kofleriaceae bacterium]
MRLLLAPAAALLLLWPRTAGAQEAEVEEDVRASFLLGGGLGLGGMSFSIDGEEAVSYDDATGLQLAFGGMVMPQLALGLDLTVLLARDEPDGGGEDLRVFERAIGVWGRYWVMRRLWLQAGLASVRAGASSDFEEYPTYDGAQIHGAVGFEVLHRTHWAIDVSLRLAAAGYGDESDVGGTFTSQSAALLVGFAWFR